MVNLHVLDLMVLLFVFCIIEVKPPSEDEDEMQDEKFSESDSEEKSPEKEVEGKLS